MASKEDIANFALALYGEPPITALDEDNRAARVMNLQFDGVRDAVLRAHKWNFAIKRARPGPLAATPDFGFARAFPLPTDFLKMIDFNAVNQDFYQMEQVDDQRVIVTDSSIAEIKYVARVTNTTLYDTLFIQALAARLASDTVYAVTNSAALEDTLWDRYEMKLAEARSMDGQENPPEQIESDDFLIARLGGPGFRRIANP